MTFTSILCFVPQEFEDVPKTVRHVSVSWVEAVASTLEIQGTEEHAVELVENYCSCPCSHRWPSLHEIEWCRKFIGKKYSRRILYLPFPCIPTCCPWNRVLRNSTALTKENVENCKLYILYLFRYWIFVAKYIRKIKRSIAYRTEKTDSLLNNVLR